MPARDPRIDRLKALSRLLDDSIGIPGTPYRIGIDPLLDLIPGIGDVLGMMASAYIIYGAQQLGLPRAALVRMLLNVAVDGVVGAVPFIGAVFDAGWKANVRNVALIEAHVHEARPGRRDFWLLVLILAGLAGLCAGAFYVAVLFLNGAVHLLR